MRKIVFATNYNDWEGLYINGVLATEGFPLNVQDILEALDVSYTEVDARQYLKDNFLLPVDLEDLNDEEEA